MVLGIERFFEWLPERPSIRYALATAIMSVAIIIRALLGLLADDVAPFATLYPAVVFATLLCGWAWPRGWSGGRHCRVVGIYATAFCI